WPILSALVGRPEWATDPRYRDFKARLAHREELTIELDRVLSERTTGEWIERMAGKVPVAPVNDVAQALDNPFERENGMIVEMPHPARGSIRTLACPVRCPGETLPLRPGPRLGAHNGEILGDLATSRSAGPQERTASGTKRIRTRPR